MMMAGHLPGCRHVTLRENNQMHMLWTLLSVLLAAVVWWAVLANAKRRDK